MVRHESTHDAPPYTNRTHSKKTAVGENLMGRAPKVLIQIWEEKNAQIFRVDNRLGKASVMTAITTGNSRIQVGTKTLQHHENLQNNPEQKRLASQKPRGFAGANNAARGGRKRRGAIEKQI